MTARRSQIDIVFDILMAVQAKGGKIKPTHLLYKSNLSHTRMKKYVEELKEKGLLAEISETTRKTDRNFFTISDAGLRFLADYRKVKELTDAFGL